MCTCSMTLKEERELQSAKDTGKHSNTSFIGHTRGLGHR